MKARRMQSLISPRQCLMRWQHRPRTQARQHQRHLHQRLNQPSQLWHHQLPNSWSLQWIMSTCEYVNNVNGKPVTVSVISSISDYLSNELGVLSALCAAVPPVVDLGMFKPTLTEQQLYSAFSTAMRKVAVFSRILHFCLSLNGKASRTNREQYCRMIAVSWTRHSEVYLICLGM